MGGSTTRKTTVAMHTRRNRPTPTSPGRRTGTSAKRRSKTKGERESHRKWEGNCFGVIGNVFLCFHKFRGNHDVQCHSRICHTFNESLYVTSFDESKTSNAIHVSVILVTSRHM